MDALLRVLGTPEVEVGGRLVDVGHMRQRAVLAALLIDANRPVSPETLADRVWGERASAQTPATIYSYVSRLRRLLSTVTGVALTRGVGGYRVEVDPQLVDLHRFRSLVAAARVEKGPAALAIFDEALALWRGEPLTGLDTPWADREREVLLGERFAAQLDRIEAALACDPPVLLLTDIEALAAEHPLDERVAAAAMLALYQSGRQADALARFDRVRRRLADDLGIDPGPRLLAAHRYVLAGAPQTSVTDVPPAASPRPTIPVQAHPIAAVPPTASPQPAAAEASRPAWVVVPRQLPAPPVGFAGRSAKLAELDRAAAGPLVTIAGSGGVGKTWLALRWAHLNLARFPDGQLYLNLRGFDPTAPPLTPDAALRSMLEALGVPATALPEQPDAAAALLRSLTAGRRMLLLLDNARDSAHVAPLLPGSPTCTVLVTSRRTLTGLVTAHGARPVALDALDAAQSRDLLVAALGEERVGSDPAATEGIIRRCAGLPLALRIVAARASVNPELPLSVLAAELEGTDYLDALDGGELTVNVRAVLSSSLHALAPGCAEAFALLGLTPTPEVSVPVLASLVGQPITRARAQLQELLHFHMLHEFEPGRFRMHDLVRSYATELAQLADDHRDAAGRMLDHYLHQAYRVNELLSPGLLPLTLPPPAAGVAMEPFGDQDAALAWYRREQQALVGAVEYAARAGFDRHAWQLTCLLSLLFSRRGDWSAHLATARLALDSAQRLDDPVALTNAHREVGVANINSRHFAEAKQHLEIALAMAAEIDAFTQAQVHRALGRLYAQQARWADAIGHDQQALDLYHAAGSAGGEARALNCIGWHLAHVGEQGEAEGYCRRALAQYEELGDPFGAALTLDSLAYALRQLGRHDEAVDCHRRSIELLLTFDRPLDSAKAWTQLAQTHEAAGDAAAAQTAWREALRIYTELGHAAADEVRERLTVQTGTS